MRTYSEDLRTRIVAAEHRQLTRTKALLTGEYPEGDTPEQAARDAHIVRRWNWAEGVGEEDMTGIAEQCREKLHDIGGGRAA